MTGEQFFAGSRYQVLKYDASRVDWVGAGLDTVGIGASIFEPHPVAMIAGWGSDVASFTKTVDRMETGQADVMDLVLDIGGFVPKFGAIPDVLSLLKELGGGFEMVP